LDEEITLYKGDARQAKRCIMSEEVLELSVEETNKLRAELGLAPLRISNEQSQPKGQEADESKSEEVLELSVEETNDLRAKLGLAPLHVGATTGKREIHKPATNDREELEAKERAENARLKQEVQEGISSTFGSSTLADDVDTSALSWAERMRQQKAESTQEKKKKRKKIKKEAIAEYNEENLEGIQVAHNISELEAGSTTVLTLADAPLLQVEDSTSKKVVGLNEDDIALENVNLAESKKQKDGLRKKRMLEMGMGRAGGYAGFDDDEFEELGGTLGAARKERGNALLLEGDDDNNASKSRGFRIGQRDLDGDVNMTDFDKMQQGKAISLLPTKADVAASDYMTMEEEAEERAKRKKKKDGKFKKKKKKKDKKKRRTKVESDEDEDMDEQSGQKPNLMEQLEKTAAPQSSGLRKRLREDSEDEGEGNRKISENGVSVKLENGESTAEKRTKYDQIMAKGNERTKLAFQEKRPARKVEEPLDEEPDDSFLNAALAKARRLNRLREMSLSSSKGADAVAQAVKSIKKEESDTVTTDGSNTSGKITFSIDDTREFTRAIRARAQQKERESQKAKPASGASNVIVKQEETTSEAASEAEKPEVDTVKQEEEEEEEMDIEELAKEVKTDDIPAGGFEGATADASGVGRGLSSFVSMLKHTGEISKRAGKEEVRGRAKDEKNYENYEPMDLSKVVKIGRNATDKDKDFANREVKLEYRDKHGRLLTPKEAFRDLCYQFHGHGASKKKEEKKLKQIAREQAEARMASRQVSAARDGTAAGTLGALKATQKATGKAFIVHKT